MITPVCLAHPYITFYEQKINDSIRRIQLISQKVLQRASLNKEELSELSLLFKPFTKSYLSLKKHTALPKTITDMYEALRFAVIVKPRNHRIITNSHDIHKKLKKQIDIAQLHKSKQRPLVDKKNSPIFKYTPFICNNTLSSGFEAHTLEGLKVFENVDCSVEVAQLLGHKPCQEDTFIASSFEISIPGGKNHTLMLSGIFDGHSGDAAALFMKSRLQDKLHQTFSSLFHQTLDETSPLKKLEGETTLSDRIIWNVLKIVCVELHEEYTHANPKAGTTASFSLLIDGEDLWNANLGDSRSILVSDTKTIQLSEDMGLHFKFPRYITEHDFETTRKDFYSRTFRRDLDSEIISLEKSIEKLRTNISKLQEKTHRTNTKKSNANTYIATLEKELERKQKEAKSLLKKKLSNPKNSYEKSIWKRGGFVCWDRRVNGALAPARTIGDKRVGDAVCPRPKITKISLSKEFPSSDSCILLHASDGLWDAATTNQIAEAIQQDKANTPAQLVRNLVYSSVRIKPFDNVSALVTKLDLSALRETRSL